MKHLPAVGALALISILGACSPASEGAKPVQTATTVETTTVATPPPTAPTPPAQTRVLGLEGLDDLKIGQAVPAGGSWAELGAQASDTCRTVTSPDYPGVYAIVSRGAVRRITLGQRSDIKLAEGIGVGAAEKDVKSWFAGFREMGHKYVDAPAKYLTAPNAESGDPALRFEIGEDGKVSLIHVGTAPELLYVEGCS